MSLILRGVIVEIVSKLKLIPSTFSFFVLVNIIINSFFGTNGTATRKGDRRGQEQPPTSGRRRRNDATGENSKNVKC